MNIKLNPTSKLYQELEKTFGKKVDTFSKQVDEDIILFEDETSVFCEINIIFSEQIKIELTILDDHFNPVKEINLTL